MREFIYFRPLEFMGKKNLIRHIPALHIENAGAEGKCVARYNNKVVFVEYAVPGDVADVRITQVKSSYMTATIDRLLEPSPERIDAFCAHFGVCGGCKWQNMAYPTQLKYKQQQVQDAFERIGKFPFPLLQPIMGSSHVTFYRNKMEYAFTDRKWLTTLENKDELSEAEHAGLGFHVPGRWDKVIDLDTCYLQDDLGNNIRKAFKTYGAEKGLPFFKLRAQEGWLRQLLLRNNRKGEWMVMLAVTSYDEAGIKELFEAIMPQFPQVKSWLYTINNKRNDSIYDLDIMCYAGEDHLVEELEDLRFIIGPKSFFQTNALQTLELYRKTRELAALNGTELVYDLYTGVGSIASFLAKKAAKVVGIEYVSQAIDDAKRNAAINQLNNVSFFAGDMKDVLNDAFIAEQGKPDVIVTDPPRAGMHEDVVKKILEVAPQRIVYVSCNPATQARDIALMQEKYKVTCVQPVDMFPHTHHVENIALLEKI